MIGNSEFVLMRILVLGKKIITGFVQGSILGSFLFNIFINDLFLFVSSSTLSNYADGNTLYASGFNLENVKKLLEYYFNAVTKCFYENHMALNAGKCHSQRFSNEEQQTTKNNRGYYR